MPMINMIAARRAERKRLERSIRLLSMAIVAVIVLAVSLYTFLGIRLMVMKGDLVTVEASLAEIQPTVDRINELESATAKLKPKVELLSKAQKSTLKWKNLVVDMSTALPDKTWLTGFSVVKDEKSGKPSVTVNGMSVRQALVGEAMLRIGDKKGVGDVKLKYTNLGKLGDEPVVNFELAANVAGMEGKPK